MTSNNGFGKIRQEQVQVILCPWHTFGQGDHPSGSPQCMPLPNDLSKRAMPLGDLVAWQAVAITNHMTIMASLLETLEIEVLDPVEAAIESLADYADSEE